MLIKIKKKYFFIESILLKDIFLLYDKKTA